jgi:peptidoglycan/xylan/chitin deacetylase (PgdA/CDA1 family)
VLSPPAQLPGLGPSLPYPLKAGVTRTRSMIWLARTGGRPDDKGLRILFYHRVADDPDDELALGVRRFREQMDFLAAEGYRVVTIPEVVDLLDRGETPARTIGLSFDDGCADVGENAEPILARHGFRATVFIASGVTDGRMRFAWYRRQPPLLSWEDVSALDGGTLSFEAHSVSHPNLLTVDDARAADEIRDSKLELEERLGRAVTVFSYPAGLFGPRERALVAAAGYRAAVSCEPGVNGPAADRLALRRRQIDARDRLLDLRAKVGGGHDTPLPLRGTYRRWRYGEGNGSLSAASSRR